jgi:hypothetical protein
MPRPETNALHDRADAVRTRSGELDLGHYGVRCLGACGYGKEGGATCDCMHCIASLYALLASVRCVAGETRRRMQAELRFSARASAAYDTEAGCGSLHGNGLSCCLMLLLCVV